MHPLQDRRQNLMVGLPPPWPPSLPRRLRDFTESRRYRRPPPMTTLRRTWRQSLQRDSKTPRWRALDAATAKSGGYCGGGHRYRRSDGPPLFSARLDSHRSCRDRLSAAVAVCRGHSCGPLGPSLSVLRAIAVKPHRTREGCWSPCPRPRGTSACAGGLSASGLSIASHTAGPRGSVIGIANTSPWAASITAAERGRNPGAARQAQGFGL